MRFSLPLRLVGLVALLAVALATPALARRASRPIEPGSVHKLRSLTDHYRSLTWTWERAARDRRTRTSFSYRRSRNVAYLRWTVSLWTHRADHARHRAVVRLERRLGVHLPRVPGRQTPLARRIAVERRLALRLRRIYPGHVPRSFGRVRARPAATRLVVWERRDAVAALHVARYLAARPVIPAALQQAFLCIHSYEAAWNADTGNGYYGGLQMDLPFQRHYGGDYLARWGTADNWPVWAQLEAAVRAYRSGRGFWPWPSTARACGLI